MAKDVILPKLGLTMTRGVIIAWHKRAGESVVAGERLFTFETDKASSDVQSEWSGTLSEILAQAGEEVDVFSVVARISEAGEDVSPGRRVSASPLARRLAAEYGIDLAAIAPADGSRIEKKDVEAARLARSTAAEKPARATAVSASDAKQSGAKALAGQPDGILLSSAASKPDVPRFSGTGTPDDALPDESGPGPVTVWGAPPSILVVDVSMSAFDALCAQLPGDAGARERLFERAASAAWDGETAPRVVDLGGTGVDLYLPGSATLPVLIVTKARAALAFDEAKLPAGVAAGRIVRFKGMLEAPALFLAR